jgi:hypothetical protein
MDADWMGDGGGSWSASGEPTVAVSADEGELGDGSESERLTLLWGDLPLRPDLTEAASDLSGTSPLDKMAELLGLSVLPEPGILERRERKERDESLVSDLLKEGYDCRTSSLLPAGLEDAAPASLELWLPMVSQCQRELNSGMEKGLDGVRVSGCGSGRVAFEYPHSLPLHPSRSDCLPGVSPRS